MGKVPFLVLRGKVYDKSKGDVIHLDPFAHKTKSLLENHYIAPAPSENKDAEVTALTKSQQALEAELKSAQNELAELRNKLVPSAELKEILATTADALVERVKAAKNESLLLQLVEHDKRKTVRIAALKRLVQLIQ